MIDQENKCDNVLSLLRKIARAMDKRSRNLIKEYDVTVPQLLILKETCNSNGSLNATQLANSISLSPATTTPIIDKLISKGYLYREKSDSDKRKIKLIPTSKGIELNNNAPTLMHEKFVDSFNTLKDWEKSMILSALERIADMIDVTADNTAPILDPTTIK